MTAELEPAGRLKLPNTKPKPSVNTVTSIDTKLISSHFLSNFAGFPLKQIKAYQKVKINRQTWVKIISYFSI